MMWPFRKRRPAPPPVSPSIPTRRPSWFEILTVTAKSRGLSPSAEWMGRVVAMCEAAPNDGAAIDIAERELTHFNLGSLDRAIHATRNELRRLQQRRRRMAERESRVCA